MQTISLREAVEAVCPPEMVLPVFVSLHYGWNDILDWANAPFNKA